jgi:hypothetical protein
VIKPALQNPQKMVSIANELRKKIVVTNRLDHWVGQLYAYKSACELKKQLGNQALVGGCISSEVYDFSSELGGKRYLSLLGDRNELTRIMNQRQWTSLPWQGGI